MTRFTPLQRSCTPTFKHFYSVLVSLLLFSNTRTLLHSDLTHSLTYTIATYTRTYTIPKSFWRTFVFQGFNGFDNLATAFFTVYQSSSQEGWVFMMYRYESIKRSFDQLPMKKSVWWTSVFCVTSTVLSLPGPCSTSSLSHFSSNACLRIDLKSLDSLDSVKG